MLVSSYSAKSYLPVVWSIVVARSMGSSPSINPTMYKASICCRKRSMIGITSTSSELYVFCENSSLRSALPYFYLNIYSVFLRHFRLGAILVKKLYTYSSMKPVSLASVRMFVLGPSFSSSSSDEKTSIVLSTVPVCHVWSYGRSMASWFYVYSP